MKKRWKRGYLIILITAEQEERQQKRSPVEQHRSRFSASKFVEWTEKKFESHKHLESFNEYERARLIEAFVFIKCPVLFREWFFTYLMLMLFKNFCNCETTNCTSHPGWALSVIQKSLSDRRLISRHFFLCAPLKFSLHFSPSKSTESRH